MIFLLATWANHVIGYFYRVICFYIVTLTHYDFLDFVPTSIYFLIFQSDFYMYDIATKRWTLITDDTSTMGGPNLIFDHQMCLDQENRTIYVFGGQTLLM